MDEPESIARTIVANAQHIRDAQDRRAYLEQACGGDFELRSQVETLLRNVEESDRPLDPHVPTLSTDEKSRSRELDPVPLPETSLEGVGSRIGPYKLLQPVGEGGMGMVYIAEQHEPVRRMVALKVIKAGMDSAQVVARFEAERQALALMDHPYIAKVLDAGTTQSGRPFFVMELVKGIPLTKYCDEHRLTLRQRLELFVPVCQAIQHAHQKGIIHRDIKPSNVLVAAYDGKPVPKVIDFGVAKAMGQKLTEQTVFTGLGHIVGTLEYMSPEQAEFNALDIDTRSDMYSLGVLLYELLTGTTPLTRQRLKDAALPEILRLIREEEPPRPSTRLSDSKESLASMSAQRQMEPAALVKAVRGEVDWIIMKALEKDRSRRYETANALARDIQRFLADEPVEACPPSATYRLKKFALRYRRALITAAAFAVLLLAAVVVSTWQAVRATVAEAKARTAESVAVEERNDAVAAREEAKQSEADMKAVLDFFQDKVLSAGRPQGQEGGLGKEVKLREAVSAAESAIAKTFGDRPLVEAAIRNTLGETYRFLGEYAPAIQQQERAFALREAKLGPDHPNTLESRNNLGLAYWSASRIDDAIRLLEQNVKLYEAKSEPDQLALLESRNNLAVAYKAAGRTDEAIRLHEQNLKECEAKLGPDHPKTLASRNDLGVTYEFAGRIAEAIRLHEQNLKLYEAKLGPVHPDTLKSRNNLALAYWSAGRTAEAIHLHEQNLKLYEAQLGPDHPDTLTCRNNLAMAYFSAGRTAEAIPHFETALKLSEAKLGSEHRDTLTSRNNLGVVYEKSGRIADAIRLHEQTLKQREATLGPEHPDTLISRSNLARAYDRGGQFVKSEALHRVVLDQTRKRFGAEDARTTNRMASLGLNLLHQHKYTDAEWLLRDCLKILQAKRPDDWKTFDTQALLGEALLGQKKYAEAEPLLLAGYQGMKEREAMIPEPSKIRLNEALARLIQLSEAAGKKEEADKWRKELELYHKASFTGAAKK